MIVLTKRNGERFRVNEMQVVCIEMIPECKVVRRNHDYYLVLESAEEIVQRIAEYKAKVRDIQRESTITKKRERECRKNGARPHPRSGAGRCPVGVSGRPGTRMGNLPKACLKGGFTYDRFDKAQR